MQLFDKRKTLKTNQEKSLFAQALVGETLKEYKLMRSMSHIISSYLQKNTSIENQLLLVSV